ncbi:MAG TPA: hypothetical protein PK509_08520 [Catalimonadaceae bacterium]|nr:hypothetical protein [Catalimonadaceae bacterium]
MDLIINKPDLAVGDSIKRLNVNPHGFLLSKFGEFVQAGFITGVQYYQYENGNTEFHGKINGYEG